MARIPGTTWVGEQSPEIPMSHYDIFCMHTLVGYAPAHAAHVSVKADGTALQSRDTAYRSAANLDGNHRVIASENEDHGERFGGTPRLPDWVPLTDEQVETNARIFAWLHHTHGIPLQLCPDSRPGSRGLAYHRQGVDGNFGPGTDYPHPGRVPGGERWSSSAGKVCPTDVRIDQLPLILERARAIAYPVQEDDMPYTEQQLTKIVRDAVSTELQPLEQQLKTMRGNIHRRDVVITRLAKAAGVDHAEILAELAKDDA